MSHYKFTDARLIKTFVFIFFCLCDAFVFAQSADWESVPEDAKAYFQKLTPKRDTTNAAILSKYRQNSAIKRLSIHTNVIDWATLLPNIGLEFDLSDTPRNNYSISVFGKYNGKATHGSLVYNVGSVRVEGRKYWRTGKIGSSNESASKLYFMPTFQADSLVYGRYHLDSVGRKAKHLGVKFSDMYSKDTTWTKEKKDSLDMLVDSLGLKTNRLRVWLYNTRNTISRDYTSGRSIDNPRNWRAYYLGVWAGYDDWNVSLTGNGRRGQGIGIGILGGYTIPLLPQKYPKEGSLDLDLGLALGAKAVKFDAYTYVPSNPESQRYVDNPSQSQTTWKVAPFPVIQDIHVSLVWRFRGIKNKVDKSLINDYFEKVAKFEKDRDDRYTKKVIRTNDRKVLEQLVRERLIVMSDSSTFWNPFHLRRIANARIINPDTVLTDADQMLYFKITENLDTTAAKARLLKFKKERQDSIESAIRQAKKDSVATVKKERQDSILTARQAIKDSLAVVKQAKLDRKSFLKDSIRISRQIADSLKSHNDSVQKVLNELRKDSIVSARDSIQNAKKSAKDSIRAAQVANKNKKAASKAAAKDSILSAKQAEKERALNEKQAAKDKLLKAKQAEKDRKAFVKDSISSAKLAAKATPKDEAGKSSKQAVKEPKKKQKNKNNSESAPKGSSDNENENNSSQAIKEEE